ncbi:pyridoxal phosphate-dependent aminotransferase [bacterium]|nr:pyridoxal phosphate-dependent aminotransferase [bacterium]
MTRFGNDRLKQMTQSEIRAMTRECERVGGINLGQGLGDLPTPPLVVAGATRAIGARQSLYSFPEGILPARERIAEKLARDNGLSYDPNGEIVVTIGASGAFAATLMALLNPGDGVLLMEPYYGYHLNTVTIAHMTPQFATLTPPDFTVTAEALDAAVTPQTRAIVACTPGNPNGRVMTQAELAAIASVAKRHDLLLITDEVYEYIVFDGRKHISPATVDGMRERTVTISSLSKTFSITGWRVGYAAAPRELARAITLANDLYYVCAPTPLQHGVAEGFNAPPEFFAEIAATYEGKRDILCDALADAGLHPLAPQGAYYCLADISALPYKTAKEAAMAILEDVGVAAVPGTAFYQSATGEKLLRFCFAKEDDVLEEAGRRLRRFRAGS